MVLSARLLWAAAIAGALGPVSAAAQCPAGSARPDFGVGFFASAEGFMMFRQDGREYVRFVSHPVVHRVRPARGGFVDNDTIIEIDGASSTSREAAIALTTAETHPRVFVVKRGAATITLRIAPSLACPTDDRKPLAWLGFALSCGCEASVSDLGITGWRFSEEPRVARIDPTSNAARSGLIVGDIVLAINGVKATDDAAMDVLSRVYGGDEVVLRVRRGSTVRSIAIVAEHARPRR